MNKLANERTNKTGEAEREGETVETMYRRFVPIGTAEEMNGFHSLMKEKNLSREDLALILSSIAFNLSIPYDGARTESEEQEGDEAYE